MNTTSYQSCWNNRATTAEAAIAAVDGSADEQIARHTGKWAALQVKNALEIQPGDHVLELGCGVGRIGRELAPDCASWTGVDISGNMIGHAAQRMSHLSNATFHQLDQSSLSMLQDNSIDKAYSIAVFCHMDKEDLFLYLQELNRVVKQGGLIFVETWNLMSEVGWRRWAYEPLVWGHSNQSERKDIARNQFCTPEEFQLYVSKAGFQPIATFSESQSIQIVAGKTLSKEALDQQKSRVAAAAEAIAYSPLYAELFGQFVDVIFGNLSAREMISFIDEHADTDESRLFRPYVMSLWKKNAELWGDPDE